MASSGGRGLYRAASHAAGCRFHHSIVSGCAAAPGSVSRLTVNVPTIVLSGSSATDPTLSIE
jgi:hypothetical protein